MMKNLYQAFYQQASQHTEAICLVDSQQSVTYAESLQIVDEVARLLIKRGVNTGDVVAIYADKSIEAVLSYLAILKCGATALTLDLAFPIEQVQYILSDANVKLVLTANVSLDASNISTAIVDVAEREVGVCEKSQQANYQHYHRAWLVYSSGTTGNPKGIAISHHTILSSYQWRYDVSDYALGERIACHIYLYWEVFRPLLKGAMVYLLNDETLHDFNALTQFIADNQVNEMLMTPSYAELFWTAACNFDKEKFSTFKRCWLNGEVVGASLGNLLKEHFQSINFYNLYSISETFDVAVSDLSQQNFSDTITSVGKVFSDVPAIILDEKTKSPLPTGEVGALYIGGDGLCEGYLNRPDLDSKAFIGANESPTGERLFKTGDKAYIDSEGFLFVLGRLDHVVKLRGYNVSLLAIESLMKAHLPIKQCVVKAIKEGCLENRVTAYIETENDQEFCENYQLGESGFSQKLSDELKGVMPHYMVPERFILKHFTLNAYSAKLDRKSLTDESVSATAKKLEAIWCEVLGINQVQAKDSFYHLGGHSLAAISLLQKINEVFSLEMSISDLNAHQYFGELIGYIEHGAAKKSSAFLSESIKKINGEKVTPIIIENASNVFLTGATGFLGIHLLQTLLSDTKVTVHCLIRGSDAKARLLDTAQKYGIRLSSTHLKRIVVYSGEADKDGFALDNYQYEALSQVIDLVIHAAANVNLLLPYEALKASNVESLYQIASFATKSTLKPIVYISSDAVFANIDTVFDERFIGADVAEHLEDGYGQSKWTAEEVLRKNSHLSYAVYRLGNLGPSTLTGISNSQDANLMLLEEMKKSAKLPATLHFESTPVNLVAQMIIQSLRTLKYHQKIFNLTAPNPLGAEAFERAHTGLNLTVMSEQDWLEELKGQNSALWQLARQSAFCFVKKYRLEHQNADALREMKHEAFA